MHICRFQSKHTAARSMTCHVSLTVAQCCLALQTHLWVIHDIQLCLVQVKAVHRGNNCSPTEAMLLTGTVDLLGNELCKCGFPTAWCSCDSNDVLLVLRQLLRCCKRPGCELVNDVLVAGPCVKWQNICQIVDFVLSGSLGAGQHSRSQIGCVLA